MKHKLLLLAVALVFTAIFSAANVCAFPVDLSTFDVIDNTVTVFDPYNSSATITEYWGPDTLSDPNLSIPADALSLTFDYRLEVAPNNDDYFDFYFGDLDEPSDYRFGGYNSSETENLIYTDTITMDLTSYAGGTLPLAFALNYDWNDLGYESVLTIYNVEINPVPEPATLLLLVMGLIGLAMIRKKIAV